MYLRAAKTDAEEAGEATDGMADSVSELRSQILALTGNKVDIQIDDKTFKSTYQILKELSGVWSQISDISKANILEMVGGKRNANVVAALLENFEVAEKSLAVSANSAGSALAENEKQLDSINGKLAKLSATFETLSQDVLESEYLKVGIDIVNFLLKILDLLAKANVLLPGIAASVLLIKGYINADKMMNSISSLIPQILSEKTATDELKKSVEALNRKEKELLRTKIEAIAVSEGWSKELIESTLNNYGLANSLNAVGRSGNTASVGVKALYASMSTLSKIGLWASAIAAVIGAIVSLVGWIKRLNEERRSAAESSAKELEELNHTIDDYKDQIISLRSELDAGNLSEQEAYNKREQLISIQESLIKSFGREANAINLVNGEIDDQIDKLNALSETKWRASEREDRIAISQAVEDLVGEYADDDRYKVFLPIYQDIGYLIGGLDNYLDYDKGFKAAKLFLDDLSEHLVQLGIGIDSVEEIINGTGSYRSEALFANLDIKSAYDALKIYESLYNTVEATSKEYFGEDYELIVGDILDRYSKEILKYSGVIKENDTIFKQHVEGLLSFDKQYSDLWSSVLAAQREYDNAILNSDEKAAQNAVQSMKAAEEAIGAAGWKNDAVSVYVEDFFEKFNLEAQKYTIKLQIKAELSNDRSQIKDSIDRSIKPFINNDGTVDKYAILGIGQTIGELPYSELSEQQKAYVMLNAVANEYNVTIEDLIESIGDLGYISLKSQNVLSSTVVKYQDAIDALEKYVGVLEKISDGGVYDTLSALELIEEMPELAGYLEKTTEGYILQEQAIQKLVTAKAKKIKLDMLEAGGSEATIAAKDLYISSGGTEQGVADIRRVIEQYSDQIKSFADFETVVSKLSPGELDQSITNWSEAATALVEGMVGDKSFLEILEDIVNGSIIIGGGASKQKSSFEKAYDEHQHYLAMEQETQEEYLNWLAGAYETAYKSGEIELDDYRKYQEEVYNGLKELFDDHLNDEEHRISLLQLSDSNSDEVVSAYSSLIDDVEQQIADYRARGLTDNSEYIQQLIDKLNEYKSSITEAIELIVKKANEALDGIKGAYDALTGAAKEYAENGYLSVDSLQAILEISPKYLSMLYDENGQLVINEKSIQAVMAARAEELGAETALAYAKKILIATENDEIEKLIQLADVTAAASGATWDMAYATLALAKAEGDAKGYNPKYYEDAYKAIANMQKITKTSVNSISAYYKTLDNAYVSQKDALEKIIDLTKELIEWEHEKQIEALEEEKEGYSDIIEQKKEMLELAKEQEDREKSVAEKIAEMAKLQAQIAQLSLDDSREAQAQRRKLEEELAALQKEVTDEQSDYAYDKQVDALDKELEEFEKTKDAEIESAEDAYKEMYGSAEKLHQAAIERMSSDWDGLYQQLLDWNYNYGSTLQDELVSAWDAASEAVKRYGSVVDAISGTDDYTVVGPGGAAAGANVLESMKKNALDWWTATASDQKTISKNQEALGYQYSALTGENIYRKNGSWFHEDGTSLFELSKDEIVHAIVNKMKQNSAMWMVSDSSLQSSLSNQNIELADRLKSVLGADIHRDANGVWWIGNKKLYDAYHSGGIVGNKPSLKQREVMAVLEEGEAVLDEEKEKNLFKVVDFISALSERLGTALDADNINRIFGGVSTLSARTSIDNEIGRSAAKIAAGIGGNITVERIEVTAPIQVTEKLDDEEIRRHSRTIGAIASAQIKESFTKQGISKGASIF